MPQRGVGELALPPIELPRGVDVRGSVAGEDNKPVAGAEVEAIWTAPEGRPRRRWRAPTGPAPSRSMASIPWPS